MIILSNSFRKFYLYRSSFLKKLEQFSDLKLKKISSGETIYELESTLVNDFDYSDGSLLVNIEKLERVFTR